jgi:hypothetical protein
VSPGGSTIPLLTLFSALKLGVLNPAGASVADFAATLASPVPKAANVAKTQENRKTFLQWDMSVPPPKDTVACVRAGRKLVNSLTSSPHGREGTIENYSLDSEVLYLSKLGWAEIIPTVSKKILRGTKWSDPLANQSAVILNVGSEFAAPPPFSILPSHIPITTSVRFFVASFPAFP